MHFEMTSNASVSLFVKEKNVSCLPQRVIFLYIFFGGGFKLSSYVYSKIPVDKSKMPSEETRLPAASEEKRGSFVLLEASPSFGWI